MARPQKFRTDHRGGWLPSGGYAQRDKAGELAGYKVRWREEDSYGLGSQPARTFSARACGSLDEALRQASNYRLGVVEIVRTEGSVLRADPAEKMTLEELFGEWRLSRGPLISGRYEERVVRHWKREIA